MTQTPSNIVTVVPAAAAPTTINLDVPVYGSPAGLVAHAIIASGVEVGTSVALVTPTQIKATFVTLPIAVWIDAAPGLKTGSNGSISQRPHV